MKPIPLRMLPNSVIYKEYIEDDGEGPLLAEGITLDKVKIQEKKTEIINPDGTNVFGECKLFYDLINSRGLKDKPKIKSHVIFEDREFIITNVAVLRANSNTPHHYEIKLK